MSDNACGCATDAVSAMHFSYFHNDNINISKYQKALKSIKYLYYILSL